MCRNTRALRSRPATIGSDSVGAVAIALHRLDVRRGGNPEGASVVIVLDAVPNRSAADGAVLDVGLRAASAEVGVRIGRFAAVRALSLIHGRTVPHKLSWRSRRRRAASPRRLRYGA